MLFKGKEDKYILDKTCQIPFLGNLYKLYLGYKKDGVFVEFGAFDGEYVSNTSGLADIGWRGLYIEPVPEFYAKCVNRHKKNTNVTVVNSAVGDEKREVTISIGGPLSTIDQSVLKKFNEMSWSKGIHKGHTHKIQQLRLDEILNAQKIATNFDILSIDVEGYEWPSLKNFKISEWKPKMVIVELHDNNIEYSNEWENCNKINDYFRTNNYRIVYKDYSNTVFIREDLKQQIE